MADRSEARKALHPARLPPGLIQRRKKDAYENSDDSDYDKQLDQGKALAAGHSAVLFASLLHFQAAVAR
jgi:hypothetical protein